MNRLTDDNFEADVLEAPGTHVVLFASDGCVSCRKQRELINELSVLPEFQNLNLHSIDRCDAPYFFSEYLSSGSIPTTCVFRSGNLLGSFLGYAVRQLDFKSFLLQHLGDSHV